MKTTHCYTANTRAAEIICEAKQAIENFKNGTIETVSMDTFLQSLQQKYIACYKNIK